MGCKHDFDNILDFIRKLPDLTESNNCLHVMQYVFIYLCLFRIRLFLFDYKGKQNLLETVQINETIAGLSELLFFHFIQ